MVISGLLIIIFYISHRYIVAWISFYNNQDERFGNSIWRWTYDYKVIGERDVSDLDDKPFVRIRNRTVTLMYCNFFTGFVISMSFVSNLLILILSK
jgi:hypothetical protein